MPDDQDLVLVCMPSLVSTLWRLECQGGRPLTQQEVERARDAATCVALPRDAAMAVARERGYADIDPNDCWDQWLIARAELVRASSVPKP